MINAQFNKELQQQINGTLPKGHTYRLGHAGQILQSAGIPNLPIELQASRLSDKSMQENHPFDLSNVKNLLKYANKSKTLNWITQQQYNSAEVAIPVKDLNVAAKIIKNFENTKSL